jgi:hypothetical protein
MFLYYNKHIYSLLYSYFVEKNSDKQLWKNYIGFNHTIET